jgi:ferritin-like protein
MPSNFSLVGIVLLIGALLGAAVSNRITTLYYKNEAAELKSAHQDAIDKANTNADAAAELYESERAKQRVKVITVEREVKRVLKDDACANSVLPDGMRDAISRAALAHTGQPDSAVPPVPAASGLDVGGSGLRPSGRPKGLF